MLCSEYPFLNIYRTGTCLSCGKTGRTIQTRDRNGKMDKVTIVHDDSPLKGVIKENYNNRKIL